MYTHITDGRKLAYGDAEPVSGRRPEPPFMELEYCSVFLKNEYCSVFLKNELSLRFLVINELS